MMQRFDRTGATLWIVLATLTSLGVTSFGFGGSRLTRSAAAITLQPENCGECDACTRDGQTGHDFTLASGGTNSGPQHGCYITPSGSACTASDGHFLCGQVAHNDSLRPNETEMMSQLVYAAAVDPTGAKAAELQVRFPELTEVVDGGQFLEVRRPCDPRVVDALIPLLARNVS
ncbi:MAG TPA: hypothetical protein VFI13_09950 [Gemmatimonadales bacterium]|nr:hypothetical protein [Gemmatimonadales bacterium]